MNRKSCILQAFGIAVILLWVIVFGSALIDLLN